MAQELEEVALWEIGFSLESRRYISRKTMRYNESEDDFLAWMNVLLQLLRVQQYPFLRSNALSFLGLALWIVSRVI